MLIVNGVMMRARCNITINGVALNPKLNCHELEASKLAMRLNSQLMEVLAMRLNIIPVHLIAIALTMSLNIECNQRRSPFAASLWHEGLRALRATNGLLTPLTKESGESGLRTFKACNSTPHDIGSVWNDHQRE